MLWEFCIPPISPRLGILSQGSGRGLPTLAVLKTLEANLRRSVNRGHLSLKIAMAMTTIAGFSMALWVLMFSDRNFERPKA